MSFRLSDFWRWVQSDSTVYNALVAAIAAWRPEEVDHHSLLERHFEKPPSFLLTDFNNDPLAILTTMPTCTVAFTPSGTKGPVAFCVGFFWPHYPVPNMSAVPGDWEMLITTGDGAAYDRTYEGDKYPQPIFGWTTPAFDPWGGGSGQPIMRTGGGKLMMTTSVIDTWNLAHDEIAFFTPLMKGTALMLVLAEDNG